jgi:hypothetical protein
MKHANSERRGGFWREKIEGSETLKSMSLGVSSRLPLVFWQIQALGLEWQGEKKREQRSVGLDFHICRGGGGVH